MNPKKHFTMGIIWIVKLKGVKKCFAVGGLGGVVSVLGVPKIISKKDCYNFKYSFVRLDFPHSAFPSLPPSKVTVLLFFQITAESNQSFIMMLERTYNFIMSFVERDFLRKLSRYMRNLMCKNCGVREAKCRAYCSTCSSSVNYLLCLNSKYLKFLLRVHAWLQLCISIFLILRCFCHYLK